MTSPEPPQPLPRAPPQYSFKSKVEDPSLTNAVFQQALDAPVTVSVRHLLSASTEVRENMVNLCKTTRSPVEDSLLPVSVTSLAIPRTRTAPVCVPVGLLRKICPISLPLREVDTFVQGVPVSALLDSGSSIVGIHETIVQRLGLPYDRNARLTMEDANGGDASTLGLCRELPIQVGGLTFHVQAHVVNPAPYQLLLGRPFEYVAGLELLGQEATLVLHSQEDDSVTAVVSTRAYLPLSKVAKTHMLHTTPDLQWDPVVISGRAEDLSQWGRSWHTQHEVFTYKRVDRKVRPVPTTMPAHARVRRHFPVNPVASLVPLSPKPPPIESFGIRLTKERWEALGVATAGFLWDEEVKLVFDILKQKEKALAWSETEKGRFKEEYFPPVVIPTVEHEPWAQRNYPLPPGLFDHVVDIIRDKIASGVYEPSTSSYRSRWFCVVKKNGALRPVHDLQPLNAVTVKDAGLPPGVEAFTERCAGHVIYTLADIFVGYDHRPLAEES